MTAAEASAIVSAWIAVSPRLAVVLGWHQDRCPACEPFTRHCAEYHEILAEYGAGPSGPAAFFP